MKSGIILIIAMSPSLALAQVNTQSFRYGDAVPLDWLSTALVQRMPVMASRVRVTRPMPCQVLWGADVTVTTDGAGVHHVANAEAPGRPVPLAIGHGCLFGKALKSIPNMDIDWTE